MKRFAILAGVFALALAPATLARDSAPDPAREAAARATVDYVFPPGTYARVMDETMRAMMDQMMESVGKMPMRELAAAGGVPQEKLAKLGGATLKEVTAIYDPHPEERMQLTMRAMTGEVTRLMTQFEPAIRDGLTQAYARRFTADQLGELNRFFATPTGRVYAADSMTIFMDPAVIARMTELVPAVMTQMPALTAKMKEATAGLPPPRKLADLSAAERDRLATLLGVPADELGEQKDYGLTAVE